METHVFEDCLQLVQRFNKAANRALNAEYELFCKCWQEMEFQYLFLAQINHLQLIQTTLAAMHVGKRLVCGRRSNGELFNCTRAQRIGGLYLLYAIYNKQPRQRLVKIQVSPETWESITDYVSSLRASHPDRRDTQQVSFILWKMVQQKAFSFTASDYYQSLGDLVDYDNVKDCFKGCKNQKLGFSTPRPDLIRNNATSLIDEIIVMQHMDKICESLSQCEEVYNYQKSAHKLPATKIFSYLEEAFKGIFRQMSIDELSEEPSTSKVAQNMRRQAMFASSSTAAIEQPEKQYVAQRRTSSYTLFTDKLIKDVEDELRYDEDMDPKVKEGGT